MGTYGYISSIALFCYAFMMLIFFSAKKNKLVNGFLLILMAMIAWTGGSFLMRMQIWPSYVLWYHVSIAGLMFLPFAYYRFVSMLVDRYSKKVNIRYLVLLLAVTIVNIPEGILLRWPDIVEEKGITRFVYNSMDWKVGILFSAAGIVVIHTFVLLFSGAKNCKKHLRQIGMIFAGIAVLFLGHIALLIPAFSSFPIDILAGIINAFFLMYVLMRKRLFQLKYLASSGMRYAITIPLSIMLFYNVSSRLNDLLAKYFLWAENYFLLVHLVLYAALFSLVLVAWRIISNNVFVKEENIQSENLKEFSVNISKSLDLATTSKAIVDVIQKTIHVKNIYICVPNRDNTEYEMLYSNQPLHSRWFSIKKDSPLLTWLCDNEASVRLSDFRYTVEYKSMWEKEKRQLDDLNAEVCVALKEDNEIAGIVFLNGKEDGKHVTDAELDFLASVGSIATIALKNSRLYEKVYQEARTDELTGLLNRKYFYEVLQEEFGKCQETSLSLAILNVDDFKLYNQLYGIKQGDEALKKIATIVKGSVGEQGYVARYSGKEFAILLPRYDLYSAKVLMESIQKQIGDINKNDENSGFKLQRLTCSVGIAAAPYGAKSVKELVDNADMAVFHVKQKGKNGIMIFDVLMEGEKTAKKKHAVVYQEYESTIFALTAAIDAKDHYTFTHSNNVAYYAMELGREAGLNEETVEIIRQAALLHDVGKIGIPENVLNKPGRLTEEEYEQIKGHVDASIGIIRHLPSLDYVIPAVIGHHERYDGNGYPRRLAGEDIPITARILCIADTFDAMISKRCYKEAVPLGEVLDIMVKDAGTHFDPKLVMLFVECIRDGRISVLIDTKGLESKKVYCLM